MTARTVGGTGAGGGAERGCAERLQVAAHGLDAAAVAALGDRGGQRGGVGVAGVEPFVQIRLERVEQAAPRSGLDQQILDLAARAKRRTVRRFSDSSRAICEIDAPAANVRTAACRSRVRTVSGFSGGDGRAVGTGGTSITVSLGTGGGPCSSTRRRATVFSTAWARLCHRCQRSATWIAPGLRRCGRLRHTRGFRIEHRFGLGHGVGDLLMVAQRFAVRGRA